MKTGVVKKFDGEYFFLSNFYPATFMWRNREYPTVEHAFQGAKNMAMKEALLPEMTAYLEKVIAAPTPAKAKYLGRSVDLDIPEWDKRKVQWMSEIIHAKFAANTSDEDLIGQLTQTGAMLLVEGNDWGDDFWGRCLKNGKMTGINALGSLLMNERGFWLKAGMRSNYVD